MSKDRPNSFENFFKDAFYYGDNYGYAVDAKDTWEAREKILNYLSYTERSEGFMNRLKRELRENMKEGWVVFQGYQDDEGEWQNGWVITSEWKGGVKGYKQVYYSDYNDHYVTYGHRYEPKADERGHRVNYSFSKWNCDVCNQIASIRQEAKS